MEEAGRFVVNELEPTDRIGDIQGAKLNEDGSVTLPENFDRAYKEYVKAGWGGVAFSPEWGGGGFPWTLGLALAEMVTSANLAFSLCPMLTQGAIHMLAAHGSEEQKSFWLPRLISGEWSGTMNLTEPQAGSDVWALTTRAEPQDDGTYRIFGQKIFITYGEHDLTENIVHLVLARTPTAPAGTKGISCFIVPKFVPPELSAKPEKTGKERNDVTCLSLEKKLGIHASPTCVMEYGGKGEGAVGYLIGGENEGMRYMFTMMNNARLGVGLEGMAIAERVYQKSLNYARERQQGRRSDAEKGTQSPIISHPDIRRSLLTIKTLTEAMRCLVYYNSAALDKCSEADPDKQINALELVNILTPLTKAWCTEMGIEAASLGIQIHGGAGFVEETGIAQHYRDIRIAPIYEGTNGIQAIDLVARKLTIRNGEAINELLAEIAEIEKDLTEGLEDLWAPISEGISAARESSEWLLQKLAEGLGEAADEKTPNKKAPGISDAALAGATPYLRLMAVLTAAWLMAKSAIAARQTGYETENKEITARFFCHQILPPATALKSSITAGDEILFAYSP